MYLATTVTLSGSSKSQGPDVDLGGLLEKWMGLVNGTKPSKPVPSICNQAHLKSTPMDVDPFVFKSQMK